jgi:hypothetical protein
VGQIILDTAAAKVTIKSQRCQRSEVSWFMVMVSVAMWRDRAKWDGIEQIFYSDQMEQPNPNRVAKTEMERRRNNGP